MTGTPRHPPSSGAARHLLPAKGRRVTTEDVVWSPSPLAGEGAGRADEGRAPMSGLSTPPPNLPIEGEVPLHPWGTSGPDHRPPCSIPRIDTQSASSAPSRAAS